MPVRIHTTTPSSLLRPTEIRARAAEVTASARTSGALEPIPTRVEIVEQAGVRFQVRVLDSRWREQRAGMEGQRSAARGEPRDPFGPCDPALLLGDLSPTHRCVLNKYPTLRQHLLIVTRHFEDQERLLTTADFHAVWLGLQGINGLGFFNGGRTAGASQAHKHMQLLPTPLHPGEPAVPMEGRLAVTERRQGVERAVGLPFDHALHHFPPGLEQDPTQAAVATLGAYHRLLAAVGQARRPGDPRQQGPANLLMTRRWMLLVPRQREAWQGLSTNALGFAGSLMARDQAKLERFRALGPMALLAHTGRAVDSGRTPGPDDPGMVG